MPPRIIIGCTFMAALGMCLGLARPGAAQVSAPAAVSRSAVPDPRLPTLFVVGDSTANNNADGARGWGDPFIAYFDTTKINVLNRARAGRSSRTFQTEGLWDQVLTDMKPDDFVLIQFGHNDAGATNDASRARGSLAGLGDETEEIDNLLTEQHEVVHTYGWYMRKFVADTRAKGAVPIIVSLTVRNIWHDGTVERGSGQFGQWAADVAKSQNVAFVDLTMLIANKYEQIGQQKVQELFATDHTHTSPEGAELNAALVVAGLKGLESCPACGYLSEKGRAVAALAQSANPPAAPRHPLPDPANPTLPSRPRQSAERGGNAPAHRRSVDDSGHDSLRTATATKGLD